MASVQQKTSTSTAEEALAVLEKEYAHFELLSSFNAASGATIYKVLFFLFFVFCLCSLQVSHRFCFFFLSLSVALSLSKQAVHRSTGEPVAIKQIDRAQGSCEKWEERLKFELEAHSTVSAHKCRNICECFVVFACLLFLFAHLMLGNLIGESGDRFFVLLISSIYRPEIIPGEKSTFLVMELCGGSQLFDLVASSPKRRLTEPLAAEITRQLVTGVRAIHDAGFIHRDLVGCLFLEKSWFCP